MVNVPPIPPLLCSTPPPIDFGDEDEDVDVLPPTLGAVDDDFEDFSMGDSKSDDTLPSPRPPSVTDLPSVSIYDGLIPPDEIYSNSSETPPPIDIVTPKSEAATNITHTNTPIVEAFNYSVVQQQTKEVDTNGIPAEASSNHESPIPTTKENTMIKTDGNNVLGEGTTGTDEPDNDNDEKQLKDVVEENATGVTNCEINVNSMKPVISPLTNIVSIEDLDDDLSEDELYSPRTPKNFTEEDASKNDYFKIHDILKQGNIEEGFKETPSLEKEPEPEAAVAKVSTEYFTNVPLQDFSIPPPLNDVSDNMNGDNDDEFGDFADFQDFNVKSAEPPSLIKSPSFDESVVPVRNTESEEISNLEDDDFDDFIQHAHPNENEVMEVSSGAVEVKSSDDNEFNDFTGRTDEIIEELNENGCKSISIEEDKHADEYQNHKSHEDLDDSFGDFSEFSDQNKALEFSKENTTNVPSISTELIHNDNNATVDKIQDNDDDDFADFQGNQVSSNEITSHDTTPVVSQQSNTEISMKVNNDDFDDDDDDFGDFSTAEPVESKTPVSQPLTSQNISTAPQIATPVILQMPKNLNERISKILKVMFANSPSTPSSPPPDEDIELKTQKIQDIPFTSIDAAKALEYQWLHSETRHAFIKSLGIDSRNILYGENWNPSLPRFAANLSFNPLKPMKPVTNSGAESIPYPTLETVPVNNSDLNKSILNPIANSKRDNIEVNWKVMSEQKTEALNDNMPASSATSTPYVATEPPESLTIFENPLEIKDKFSKTPPISEMESVNTFSTPLPSLTTLEIELPPASNQIVNSFKNLDLNESDDTKDTLEVVVASTTFSGSFKETHIYTPPKTIDNTSSTSSTSTTSPSKTGNIDFDYEKAAMGVIIDETVVKKEYRDIEYNSPFSTLDTLTRTSSLKSQDMETSNNLGNLQSINDFNNDVDDDFNDEFSDFQSVPTTYLPATTSPPVASFPNINPLVGNNNSNPSPIASEVPKPANVSACGMILSPAILIPQAISMESNKPKIEWGDSTTSINPEELARIEELYAEPAKVVKSNTASSSSQKSTPTHQAVAPTISAAVANKELEGNNDDDDWSDFVSVPVANNNRPAPITNNNPSIKNLSNSNSPFKQRSPVNVYRPQNYKNSNNDDDDWSDFVSSAPPPSATANTQGGATHRVAPQFNSGAWQNANFYNNPLSLYHKGLNMHHSATASVAAINPQQSPKNFLNNNNYNQQYNQFQTATNAANQQQQLQQQIHVMQNFSTAPVPERMISGSSAKNNQFQVGSAKVAPSIALIPDLGFVAPAIPTHTSFINSLPKPSINTKK